MFRINELSKLQQQQSHPGSPEQTRAKPTHARLRASCDSCLTAKVKCTKTRPVCARCLSNGAPCAYSPSARAGRQKSSVSNINTNRRSINNTTTTNNSNNNDNNNDEMEASPSGPSLPKSPIRPTPPYYNDPSPAQTESGMFGCSPPHSMEEDQRRMAQDITQRMQEDNTPIMSFLTSQPTNAELMSTFLPMASSPPCPGLGAALLTPELESPPRPEWATNLNTSMSPWSESHLDMTPMGQVSYSCEPLHPTISTHSSNSDSSQNMGSMTPDTMTPDPRACDCFTVCLQALQSLHFHSSTQQGTLPFDVVLTINREAIEGCSAMLSCTKCLSKSGSSIWTMLLATLIGKVVSLYRSVSYSHTSPLESPIVRAKSQGSVTFGAYRIASEDEKMLEMEILLIELRKVKKILDRYQGKFRIAQAEKDEMSVYGVLASHMAQNLHFLYEFLRVRKSGASQNVRRNIDI